VAVGFLAHAVSLPDRKAARRLEVFERSAATASYARRRGRMFQMASNGRNRKPSKFRWTLFDSAMLLLAAALIGAVFALKPGGPHRQRTQLKESNPASSPALSRKERQLRAVHAINSTPYGYVAYDWKEYSDPYEMSQPNGRPIEQPDMAYLIEGETNDELLAHVGELSSLERLFFFNTPVSDSGLAHLQKLPILRDIRFSTMAVSNDALGIMRTFPHLEQIEFYRVDLNDDHMAHLGEMLKLKQLYAGFGPITDEGLSHLGGCTSLQHLHVGSRFITNDGLKHLGKLGELETLSLHGTQISNDGLMHLSRLPRLSVLDLTSTRIDDEGLIHLRRLPLKKLHIGGTSVSTSGRDTFRDWQPNCQVVR
jgi:hypothetical protein